jgi:two-component system chemotaxis response regulator CheY
MSVWRVLVIDDSALIRNAMQSALEPYGLEIGQAENGAIGVDKALSSNWDLIFLDVVMPIMDGPTALRTIRASGNTTPVVLVTSVSTAAIVASAIKLGRVSYIGKPFTPEQIRAIASKQLKLDPQVLLHPPRVLLQHTDPALPGRLRKLLPAHVAIDTSHSLAESLDLAESERRDLVLFESRDLADEMVVVANVIRRVLPTAGIFAITDDATGMPWQPDESLDGRLSSALDDAVVRGFLYPSFLRPLVVVDGKIVHAAGFRGPPAHLPVYVAMLGRVLVERCARLDPTADLQIDLTRMPDDPDALVAVITAADHRLRAVGAAPAFQINPGMRATLAGRLAQVVLV